MTVPFLHYTHRGNSHSEIRWSKFYSFWVFCIERSNHTSTEHQWPIKHSAGKSRLPSIKKFTGLQDGEDLGGFLEKETEILWKRFILASDRVWFSNGRRGGVRYSNWVLSYSNY